MSSDNGNSSKFDAIRARAAKVHVQSLQTRLNSVSLLCDIAVSANPNIAAEAIERAQTALDRIRQELAGSETVRRHSGELMIRIAEVEAELEQATRRLRIMKGEE